MYDTCLSGSMSKVRKLIEDTGGHLDWNAGLIGACRGGHVEIVKVLLDVGNPNKWNDGLRYACESGNLELVQLMISKGANEFSTALWHTCVYSRRDDYIEIAKLMISNGAHCSYMDVGCCYNSGKFKLMELLILHGANINHINYDYEIHKIHKYYKTKLLIIFNIFGNDVGSVIRDYIINKPSVYIKNKYAVRY